MPSVYLRLSYYRTVSRFAAQRTTLCSLFTYRHDKHDSVDASLRHFRPRSPPELPPSDNVMMHTS
jgi:hypothetical protein